MEAKELRIGNIVVSIDEKPITITGIFKQGVHDEKFKIYGFNEITPILLTEEWLLKFGFRKTNESEDVEWYNLNSFEIAIHEEDGKVYFVYQHMVLRHILNVHQLQNLYFALTGDELLTD